MDDIIAQQADEIEDLGRPDLGDIENMRNMHNAVRDLWRRAPDWYNITELNRRYLEGRLNSCPSYGGPIYPETDEFLGLRGLHDYGLISTSSCPGWEDFNLDTPSRQRAFLFFSIPTLNLGTTSPNALRNFIRALVDSDEVYAYIRFQYYSAPDGVQRDSTISGMIQGESYDNLPPFDGPVWRWERWIVDMDEHGEILIHFVQEQFLDDSTDDWDPDNTGTYSISTYGSAFEDDQDPFPASHAADPLQIAVVAREWSYTGTEIGNLIKNLLHQSGILRAFRRESDDTSHPTTLE